MDGQNLSLTKTGKKFLIKKKITEETKVPKNFSPMPGLPNILVKVLLKYVTSAINVIE